MEGDCCKRMLSDFGVADLLDPLVTCSDGQSKAVQDAHMLWHGQLLSSDERCHATCIVRPQPSILVLQE